MRRLARRLFTLCSAVSLVLCMAVCMLWGRSYRGDVAWDTALWRGSHPGGPRHVEYLRTVTLADGGARFSWMRSEWDGPVDARFHLNDEFRLIRIADGYPIGQPLRNGPTVVRSFTRWGFQLRLTRQPGLQVSEERGSVTTPLWFPAATSAALPLVWLHRLRRRLRASRIRRLGLCPSCGYDLRATPGRCPECGGGG